MNYQLWMGLNNFCWNSNEILLATFIFSSLLISKENTLHCLYTIIIKALGKQVSEQLTLFTTWTISCRNHALLLLVLPQTATDLCILTFQNPNPENISKCCLTRTGGCSCCLNFKSMVTAFKIRKFLLLTTCIF